MVGVFDDLPAVNFGNLAPLPAGYAVVFNEGDEMFYGTKRGTDLTLGPTWNRYWCRRWCFDHAAK